MVQVAGTDGGLAVSLLSEVISQRWALLLGLLLHVLGSILSEASQDAYVLLAPGIIECAGVIMTTVMAQAGSFARTIEERQPVPQPVGRLHGHGDVLWSLQHSAGPTALVVVHLVVLKFVGPNAPAGAVGMR